MTYKRWMTVAMARAAAESGMTVIVNFDPDVPERVTEAEEDFWGREMADRLTERLPGEVGR